MILIKLANLLSILFGLAKIILTLDVKSSSNIKQGFMKLSKKMTLTLRNQSLVVTNKRPKQFISKLNSDISSIQDAVKQYNLSQQRFSCWKKQLNLNGTSCQLKRLTEPKFQNVLLENNFLNENQMFMNSNQSRVNVSRVGRGNLNLSKKSSIYGSGIAGVRKTFSFMKDTSRDMVGANYERNANANQNWDNQQKNKIKGNRSKQSLKHNFLITQNPQPLESSTIIPLYQKPSPLVSFREQGPDKMPLKQYKHNFSQNTKLPLKRATSIFQQQQQSKQMMAESKIYGNDRDDDGRDNLTIIGQQSKSIFMQLSKLTSQDLLLNKNLSKQSLLVGGPRINSKQPRLVTMRNTAQQNLRKKIQEKNLQLQKQWSKMEQYRDKYHIGEINSEGKTAMGMTSGMQESSTRAKSNCSQTNGRGDKRMATTHTVMTTTTEQQESPQMKNRARRTLNKLDQIIQKVESNRRPKTSMHTQCTNSRKSMREESTIHQRDNNRLSMQSEYPLSEYPLSRKRQMTKNPQMSTQTGYKKMKNFTPSQNIGNDSASNKQHTPYDMKNSLSQHQLLGYEHYFTGF